MSITAAQVKEARRLLGWSQLALAVNAGTGLSSVSYVEAGKRPLGERVGKKLQSTLEAAGVEFIAVENGSAGVRLRNSGK